MSVDLAGQIESDFIIKHHFGCKNFVLLEALKERCNEFLVNSIVLDCCTLQQWISVTKCQHFVRVIVGQLVLFIFLGCKQKLFEILSSVSGRLPGLLPLQTQQTLSSSLHHLYVDIFVGGSLPNTAQNPYAVATHFDT
jgi:hypothetical protein